MLKITAIFTCAVLAAYANAIAAETTVPLTAAPASLGTLRYDRPAKDWRTEALPIGNGRIGAMMFGGVAQERIQFNEQTLWIGRGGWFEWPHIKPFGCYQNFGDVALEFKGSGTPAKEAAMPDDYRRELDIGTGIHRVVFTRDGVRITREAFASQPDQVLVFRYTADKPGAFSGQVALKLAQKAEMTTGAGSLTATGVLVNGMKFACKLQILHEGGTLLAKDGVLTFDRCDRLTLLLDARTDYAPDYHANWKGAAPEPVLEKELAAAAAKPYTELRSAHLAEFTPVMKRVALDLGATAPHLAALATDKRLAAYAKGGADPELEALEFQYGRYILFSSSRPDSILPANLQGIWNDSNDPNWTCDWHTDINVDMAYWAAENANLSECHLPLFRYLEAQAVPHRILNQKRFGEKTRGWTAYLTMNPFGGGCCEIFNGSSAWLAQHFFDHWDYTRDREFLRTRTYPFLKEICQYWEDRLKPLPNGKLVAPDGWSPEHGPHHTDGVMGDQQLIWQLFQDYLTAARELGVDAEFQQKVADLQARLSIHKIGRFGQLQEWQEDWDKEQEGHRHLSHLLCAYPGRQVTPEDTPALAKAAIVSLKARVLSTDAAQSWGWPWRAALWARFKQPETAYGMLRCLLSRNTAPNLLTFACPPPTMQTDGMGGYPAALIEMLVQSHRRTADGTPVIELLPALPKAWPTGKVCGLRARGGFTVDIAWNNSRLTAATIRANARGGKCELCNGGEVRALSLKPGETVTW